MIDPSEYFRKQQHPSSYYPSGTAPIDWEHKPRFTFQDRDLEESFIGEISVDDIYLHLEQNDGGAVYIPHKRGHGFRKTFDYLPESVTVGIYQTPNGRSKLTFEGLGAVDITGLEGFVNWKPVIEKAIKEGKSGTIKVRRGILPGSRAKVTVTQKGVPPGYKLVQSGWGFKLVKIATVPIPGPKPFWTGTSWAYPVQRGGTFKAKPFWKGAQPAQIRPGGWGEFKKARIQPSSTMARDTASASAPESWLERGSISDSSVCAA